ncbi:alkane oxidation protein activator PraB [Pseudomonas sp. WS 5079]|uniref:alkane oxidation protein activator PraB n=1 Tax=Pseudomonas sp. WS 5079 TaxID=2717492 RepID=UPI0015546C5E|nr:alkane oxidation protein activator PraB [Pseudomonas sp. WS 5079]NMX60828.1 protein activator of alkane oxidation PraB [Pseudomonas sp. WS 5079]
MKSLKTLVCVSSFALCFGAASMASAASIVRPGGPGTFETPTATITIKTPSSFNQPIQCNMNFKGTVNADGTATITSMEKRAGGNALCGAPKMKGTWTLTADSVSTGTITGVGFTVASLPATDCGPSPVPGLWSNSTNTLTLATTTALSGGCTITSMSITPDPLLTVTP